MAAVASLDDVFGNIISVPTTLITQNSEVCFETKKTEITVDSLLEMLESRG